MTGGGKLAEGASMIAIVVREACASSPSRYGNRTSKRAVSAIHRLAERLDVGALYEPRCAGSPSKADPVTGSIPVSTRKPSDAGGVDTEEIGRRRERHAGTDEAEKRAHVRRLPW